ncbi:ANTAR domain-containing protein [Cellulomonas sp. URHD0024]|uniref:ANTAR domain-containing protein n=1 Tax=Cellulomonas sp. URHD0024 TaxID=1302620 RepID=UPI0003FDBE91|nr:ANTAR domain-containing protein [Cellulomonas sp. URHD0024]
MTTRNSAQALADAASHLVQQHDVTSVLAQLVQDSAQFIPADAAAFLARTADGTFELLSASSHKAVEIELYQAQAMTGPCIDAARSGHPTAAVGEAQLLAAWPEVGRAIVDAGFLAVHAFPMRWQGVTLGGLNLFSTHPDGLDGPSCVLAQSFADFATLAVIQPEALADDDLAHRVSEALAGRVVVEQAKGVLAYDLGLDMEAAYAELVERAVARRSTLGRVAAEVLGEAQRR